MAFKCVDGRSLEERVKSMVAEILAAESASGNDGRKKNINDIENLMIRIGDLVAREVGVQELAEHLSDEVVDSDCPKCGTAGEQRGHQTRDLVTRRGTLPITEAKPYCPRCRQLFSTQTAQLGIEDPATTHPVSIGGSYLRRRTARASKMRRSRYKSLGLVKSLPEFFPEAGWQRCVVH